jgi:hypothetical protein
LVTARTGQVVSGARAAAAGDWSVGANGRDLGVLYDAVRQLAGLRDTRKVSQLVIEHARALLETDLAFIALRDPQDKALHMLACVGHRTKEFMGFARPVEQGVAVFERRPLYSADFLNDNRLGHHPDTDARVRAEGIRSVLAVPLTGCSSIVGMLAVANRSVHSFTEREVSILSELSAQAALALDNARLYSEAISGAARTDKLRLQTELALSHIESVQELHDSMIDALLSGQGLAGVLSILHQAFDLPVIATDWRNVVIAHRGADQWLDPNNHLSQSLLSRVEADRATESSAGDQQPTWRGGSLLMPVATSDEILGYLWFPAAQGLDREEALVAAARRAGKVLALELLRARVVVETERRLGRDFLLNLLGDTPSDLATQESLARQVWRRYGSAHRPVTIRVGPEQPTPTGLLERARRTIAEARPGDLVAIHRGEIVLMLGEVDRRRVGDEIGRLTELCKGQGMELSIVVGTPCRDLADDRSCTLACAHLHDLLGRRPVIWLEELEPLTILFDSNERDRLDRFVVSVLGSVSERPDLLATLRAYYAAGRNRAKAARTLNVHVNTLRYRLERIETLLGQPITNPAKEAAIQLAIAVHGGRTPKPDASQ